MYNIINIKPKESKLMLLNLNCYFYNVLINRTLDVVAAEHLDELSLWINSFVTIVQRYLLFVLTVLNTISSNARQKQRTQDKSTWNNGIDQTHVYILIVLKYFRGWNIQNKAFESLFVVTCFMIFINSNYRNQSKVKSLTHILWVLSCNLEN